MNSYAKLAVFIGVLLFSVSLMSVAINYLGDLSDVDFQVEIEQDMVPATKEPGEKIKANKELMDEADSWQKFGELLAQMNEEQVQAFIGLLQNEIRAL